MTLCARVVNSAHAQQLGNVRVLVCIQRNVGCDVTLPMTFGAILTADER